MLDDLPKEELASRIREAIAALGLSKQEVAERTGVSKQAITGWLKNGRISKKSISQLSSMTGKPVEFFMFRDWQPALKKPARTASERLTIEGSDEEADPRLQLIRAQNSIQSLRYIVGAMATMMASLRPAEGAAVAALIRSQVPPEYVEGGFGKELLQAIDAAVRVSTEQPVARRA